jgi:predicted enzyme related to lactoylglutathione lyase
VGRPVVHFEIVGVDGERLQRFYSDLFEWETVGVDANPDYGVVAREQNLNAEGVGIGGGVSGVPEQPSSTWRGLHRSEGYEGHVTFYVEVPDVEAALQEAERLGGKRMLGPDAIPNGPEIGAFTDPEGHLLGLVKSAD